MPYKYIKMKNSSQSDEHFINRYHLFNMCILNVICSDWNASKDASISDTRSLSRPHIDIRLINREQSAQTTKKKKE